MTQRDDSEGAPVHSDKHEALAVFLGRWRAEGESYGSPKQAVEAPKRVTELGSALTPASGTPGSSFSSRTNGQRSAASPSTRSA